MKKLLLAAIALSLVLPFGLFGQSAAGGGRKTFTISVSSNAPGAQVFVNGEAKGAAPLDLKLPAGTFDLAVKADGYADYATKLVVSANAKVYAELSPLAAAGTAKLTVKLSSLRIINARVSIDGVLKGLVSGGKPLGIDLPVGGHQLLVELEGYASYTTSIDLKKNAEIMVDLKPGAVVELAVPAAVANASFYLDGKFYGNASGAKPFSVGLAAGSRDLKVTAEGYKDWNGSIAVAIAGASATVTLRASGEKDVVVKGALGKPIQVLVDLKSAFTPVTATLTLKTSIKVLGAQVYVDGIFKGGLSGPKPLDVELPFGVHDVLVKADGYADYSAKVALDKDMELYADLKAALATLTVKVPGGIDGAQVYLNGSFKGNATGSRPLSLELGPGTYELLVKAEGYGDYSAKIALDRDTEVYADLRATSFALSFSCDVRDAEVWLGDKLVGKAPITLVLPAGTYSYKVRARGYGDYAGSLVLSKDTRIDAKLAPATALISFDVPEAFLFRDEGNPFKNFRVFIDGKLVKDRDLSDVEIAAGMHTVKVVTGGLKFESALSFEAGKKYRISLDILLKLTEISGGR